MNKLKNDKNKLDLLIFCVLFIFHIAFIYVISSYTKRMETYGDELIYIELARCISSGSEFEIHAAPFNFTNVLYSIVLSPVFLVRDTLIRVKLITLINSFLVTTALIPVYLLCKELKLSRRYKWFVIALIFVWPDMTIAATFMSENLYFPLSLFAMYLCVKSYNNDKVFNTLLAGMVSYFTYFCKEVGLCVALAYISVEIIFGLLDTGGKKEKLVARIMNVRYKHILLFALSFALCHIGCKFVFLRDVKNTYAAAGTESLALLVDASARQHLAYSVLYMLVCAMIAFFVIPILVPALNYKKMSFIQRKAFIYEIILLIGTFFVIGMTISVKEDLGKPFPTIHLRYFFPIIGVVLAVFFASIQEVKGITKRFYLLLSVICLVIAGTFRGVSIGCSTGANALLLEKQITEDFMMFVGVNFNGVALKIILLIAILCALLFLVICALGLRFITINMAIALFEAVMLGICLVNSFMAYNYIKETYGAEDESVFEMVSLNNFFIGNGLADKNVLFVGAGAFSVDSKIYDLYFDAANDEMEISYDKLIELANRDDYSGILSDIKFHESLWGTGYHIDTIDYIIVGDDYDGLENIFNGIEIDNELSGNEFIVYKNIDSSNLEPMRKE